MRLQHRVFLAGVAALCLTHAASAQSVFNPTTIYSPYSRPHLSPYLNLLNSGTAANTYYGGVLRENEIRNQMLRPIVVLPDAGGYDPFRSTGSRSIPEYDPTIEAYINQRIRESEVTPTGHAVGFLIYNPYYNMPNQRSFIPYNPNQGMRPAARR